MKLLQWSGFVFGFVWYHSIFIQMELFKKAIIKLVSIILNLHLCNSLQIKWNINKFK